MQLVAHVVLLRRLTLAILVDFSHRVKEAHHAGMLIYYKVKECLVKELCVLRTIACTK